MAQTFTVTDAVELAVVDRSGFVESRHAGAAIVINPEGETMASYGNVDALILPRSSLKPLQALGSVTAGAPLEGVHLGLATASHTGTDAHVAVVREILAAGQLTEDALQCPPAFAEDKDTKNETIRELGSAERIRMNCSGKHAAMLLACVANGWDTETYLDPNHALQFHIRELIERLTGSKVSVTAIDGCGAPVYGLSLSGLGRAIHRVGASSESSPFALHRTAATMVRAVRENPWTIQGPGAPDSVIAERLGVFSKAGAEGVQIMVAPTGTTVALKTLDGSSRAGAVVALTLLVRAGALDRTAVAEVLPDLNLTVTGGGRDVGMIRPTI